MSTSTGDSVLVLTRQCAAAMNELCQQLRLGNQAIKFVGDDAAQWDVLSPLEVNVVPDGRKVAQITLVDEELEIVVPDVYELIRPEHVADFDPLVHDIAVNPARDWKGDKQPDLIVRGPVPEVARGPRVFIPKEHSRRKWRVLGSLSA